MPRDSQNNFPKLHNAMWPGLVGKGPDSEPPIDLDTMLDLTAAASVNGQRFEGVDLFLFDPHISIDSSDDHLKRLVGTWDAQTDYGKGTMTYQMGLGGLWLIGDFEGEFGGMKFEGKGLDTYDAATKKYRSVWVDSFSTSPRTMEGDLDKDGNGVDDA